ncbi:predicted protein [Nematostella vectensis]|uniref:Mab-21-like nucleotidyltransferase domain-containing protein n=1 Tax=Nematostella vectensis TaxID=45351 RepID=A7RYN6_NEMVE|nr:predicted protein [Nematostella vectensis]|eukprot:XP_001635413.1 predicted protein [Nematostella vectensis]
MKSPKKEQHTTKFVAALISKVSVLDPALDFSDIILTGSVSEGLKVHNPDEYDYLLILNVPFSVYESEDFKPGFVGILGDPTLPEDFLYPLRLRKRFSSALMKTVREFYSKEVVGIYTHIKSAAIKLQVHYDDVLPCCTCDIDLVIALKGPEGYWPRCAIKWLSQSQGGAVPPTVVNKVIKDGVHFVPKIYEGACDNNTCCIPMWRISFSLAEATLIRSLNEVHKNSFRILKALINSAKEKRLIGNKWVTSYHLKSLLLHANEAFMAIAHKARLGYANRAMEESANETQNANEVKNESEATTEDSNETLVGIINEAMMENANKTRMEDANEAIMEDANEAMMENANKAWMDNTNEARMVNANKAMMENANEAMMENANKAMMENAHKAMMGNANEVEVENTNEALTANTWLQLESQPAKKALPEGANAPMADNVSERDYVIDIITKLIQSLRSVHLPHYFVPTMNLFEYLKYLITESDFRDSFGKGHKDLIRGYEKLLAEIPEDLNELRRLSQQGQTVYYWQ